MERFVLRRTKDVIQGSLPPALEVVVFCRLSAQQLALYKRYIAASSGARALLDGGGRTGGTATTGFVGMQGVLPLISTLRRLCNHPDLVVENAVAADGSRGNENVSDDEHEEDDEENCQVDSDEEDIAFLLHDAADGHDSGRRGSTEGGTTTVSAVAATDLSCEGKENDLADSASSRCDEPSSKGAWKVSRTAESAPGGKSVIVGGNASLSTVEQPASPSSYSSECSGKLVVLEALLRTVRREYPSDKVQSCR